MPLRLAQPCQTLTPGSWQRGATPVSGDFSRGRGGPRGGVHRVRKWCRGAVRTGARVVTSGTPPTPILGRAVAGNVPNRPALVTRWPVTVQFTYLTGRETRKKTEGNGSGRGVLESPRHNYPADGLSVLIEATCRVNPFHRYAEGRVNTNRVTGDEV